MSEQRAVDLEAGFAKLGVKLNIFVDIFLKDGVCVDKVVLVVLLEHPYRFSRFYCLECNSFWLYV